MAKEVNKVCLKHDDEEYDVSEFLRNHPGGYNYVEGYHGFKIRHKMLETSHSKSAMYLLREYKVEGRNETVIQGQEDLEYLVNWNNPILPQVGELGARYYEWVTLPVDRQLRLFKSPVLEALTITPWYIVPIFWTPIISYFLYSGLKPYGPHFSVYSGMFVAGSFLLGVVNWTLLEYSLHRWVFHIKPSGNSKMFIYFHFAIHGLHHKVPFDSRRLVFPPIPAAIICVLFYFIYSQIYPVCMLDLVSAGTASGYLIYDMMHFYLHYGSPKENTYLYVMKRYHNQHHFSHSESGFGISNLYWDRFFGTAITLRKLFVGIKWRHA